MICLVREAVDRRLTASLHLVIIQHEYGIYGGADGDYLLEFTARLKKPYLLVTHTILPYPTANEKLVLSALCRQAAGVDSLCLMGILKRRVVAIQGLLRLKETG